MDVLVTLFILLFFVLVPLLPALVMHLMHKVAGHGDQARPPGPKVPVRRLQPPTPRSMAPRHEHPGEAVREAPISLEIIPRRPSSLEEIMLRSEVPLEEIPPPAPRPETRPERKPALLRQPIDVRRGIILGALLGRPRGD